MKSEARAKTGSWALGAPETDGSDAISCPELSKACAHGSEPSVCHGSSPVSSAGEDFREAAVSLCEVRSCVATASQSMLACLPR